MGFTKKILCFYNTLTLPSSSGKDAALSRRKQGFNSPRERQIGLVIARFPICRKMSCVTTLITRYLAVNYRQAQPVPESVVLGPVSLGE